LKRHLNGLAILFGRREKQNNEQTIHKHIVTRRMERSRSRDQYRRQERKKSRNKYEFIFGKEESADKGYGI
jgi:hypothetical protein